MTTTAKVTQLELCMILIWSGNRDATLVLMRTQHTSAYLLGQCIDCLLAWYAAKSAMCDAMSDKIRWPFCEDNSVSTISCLLSSLV